MSIKKKIKAFISEETYTEIRNIKRSVICCKYRLNGLYNYMKLQNKDYEVIDVLDIRGKQAFFGYYDIQQFDASQNNILLHILPQNAQTGLDYADIVVYNINTKQFTTVAKSSAWSWQQGARLRWSPVSENHILFNTFNGKTLGCEIWDISKKELVREIPVSLYDIDSKQTFGLGVNFVRLQRLRPGYGYCNIEDKTKNYNVPQEDGIYKYDFDTDEVRYIITYSDLIKLAPCTDRYQHYINHISISPDGQKFMFFHIWQLGNVNSWKLQMCVADVDGGNIKVLEDGDIISHYTWRDNKHLLTTKINKNSKESCYAEYDVMTGKKIVIGESSIKMDGHPSFTPDVNIFVSDTYPQSQNLQYLFLYDIAKKEKIPIMTVFHDTRMYGEKRCDLHPRITPDGKYITFDTVKSGSRKQIIILKKK